VVESHRFRKAFIALSYTALVIASLINVGRFRLPQPYSGLVRFIGVALFITSVLVAVKIHSMFPKGRHDRPEDFSELMTEGPYAYCRHPFYLTLIINQLSIPLLFTSWAGLLAYVTSLPGWYALIRLEERELIEYWGDEYLKYMEEVPALIPIPRRRCGDERGKR